MAGEKISSVKIGGKAVGDGNPCYVVAEIGINHNGDLGLALRLIDVAVAAGCERGKISEAHGRRRLLHRGTRPFARKSLRDHERRPQAST